jgi:hypothetical protein
MTINKVLGQALKEVGIDLRKECFHTYGLLKSWFSKGLQKGLLAPTGKT